MQDNISFRVSTNLNALSLSVTVFKPSFVGVKLLAVRPRSNSFVTPFPTYFVFAGIILITL